MEKLQKMLDAKIAKKDSLVARSKESDNVEELRSINAQLDELNTEITDLRGMVEEKQKEAREAEEAAKAEEARAAEQKEQEARTAAMNEVENKEEVTVDNRSKDFDPGKGFEARGAVDLGKQEEKENREAQAKDLREGRSVTVASSNLVIPTHESNTINDTFLQISNLIDAVNVLNLPGGESYTQPYEISLADAGYTAEGADPTTADMTFGYAQIAKAKLTAYSEITEEVEKLPAAPYASTILAGISKSIRKKMAKEILVGAGTTNTLTGIFTSTVIDASTDMSVATIDNTTLDNIIYSYGGDEAVEGACVLILNKKDLAAFAKLRNTDGSKFHDIRPSANGGSGTIDGTPYIINSACGAVSASGTATDTFCMAYGNLKNYQLTVFSQMDVAKSTDYKFKEGMIAHRGVIFAGGNVVSHNGFIRVKKAAAV